MYEVELECFQGPLDLLLHLIEKMEIDIYNIPIATLTDSYLNYISSIDKISLENAEEYILMAATLIHIKSKSLLPDEIEDNNLLEDELVQQLIDYRNYKELSLELKKLADERSQFLEKDAINFDNQIDIKSLRLNSNVLLNAFKKILSRFNKEAATEIKYRNEVSLSDIKLLIMKTLEKNKYFNFYEFINDYLEKNQIIAIFICLLDMLKNNDIFCEENDKELRILLNKNI